MISVRGCGCLCQERPFVAPFVAPSIALSIAPSVAPLDFFPPPKSEISEQPDQPPRPKSDTSVLKYSKNDLQKIFKAVLEAQAPASTPALASVVSEVPREKLKARSLDVYRGKSHMDCYNFCQ